MNSTAFSVSSLTLETEAVESNRRPNATLMVGNARPQTRVSRSFPATSPNRSQQSPNRSQLVSSLFLAKLQRPQ
jgi:hypothetical protein